MTHDPNPSEVTHRTPPDGYAVTPCCGRTPFELPSTDRLSNVPDLVTCTGPVVPGVCRTCGHDEAWHHDPATRPKHTYKPVAAATGPAPGPGVVSVKHSADHTEEQARATLQRFRDEGLLWLVNTSVLHPRGYALSIEVDPDDGQVTGMLGVIDFGEYSCFDIAEIGDTVDRYTRAEITREADRNGRDVPFPEGGDSSDE